MNIPTNISLHDQLLSQIGDVWYTKMRDDHRVNRYFYDRPITEQAAALKQLLKALLAPEPVAPRKLSELADAAFTAAFARGNAKPSLVNNRDFAFLGTLMNGNIVGDDSEVPRLTLLCPAQSHFLRLNPIDEAYDVAVELLQAALAQLNVANEVAAPLVRLVAAGKNSVMGRGEPIFDDEERSSRFSTHG